MLLKKMRKPMIFVKESMTLHEPCKFCGTFCDFKETQEPFSIEMERALYYTTANKSKSKTKVLTKVECLYCGTKDIRWSDEKIECHYCGELV